MPSDDRSIIERMRGKRSKDIDLPRPIDSPRDHRLPPPSGVQATREALQGLKSLADKTSKK
jgi:hypothetical protein